MIRWMMFLCIAGLTATTSFAQIKKPGITLGGTITGASPKGSFKNNYNFGVGAEAFAGVGWGNTFLMGAAGYGVFHNTTDSVGRLTQVPLRLGLRQFFLKKHLFVHADAGLASVKNKYINEGRFTRSVGVGARLLGLEVGLYYDGFKNAGSGFSNSIVGKAGFNFSI